jgi:hypothetical protein
MTPHSAFAGQHAPSANTIKRTPKTIYNFFFGALIAIGATLSSCAPIHARAETFRAHLNVSDKVSDDNIALPVYPGATRTVKRNNSSDAADVSFGWGSFGFKLNVVTMQSADAPEKVAAFYRSALARYGDVLDCGLPKDNAERKRIEDETKLSCKGVKPKTGAIVFRAGKKNNERVVSIEPSAKDSKSGSEFSLVTVTLDGVSEKTSAQINVD